MSSYYKNPNDYENITDSPNWRKLTYSELIDMREIFGKDFSVRDLIEIYKVNALLSLSQAVVDLPENLLDQVGLARNSTHMGFKSSIDELNSMACALNTLADSVKDISWGLFPQYPTVNTDADKLRELAQKFREEREIYDRV